MTEEEKEDCLRDEDPIFPGWLQLAAQNMWGDVNVQPKAKPFPEDMDDDGSEDKGESSGGG